MNLTPLNFEHLGSVFGEPWVLTLYIYSVYIYVCMYIYIYNTYNIYIYTDRQIGGRTDGRTDRQTDIHTYAPPTNTDEHAYKLIWKSALNV